MMSCRDTLEKFTRNVWGLAARPSKCLPTHPRWLPKPSLQLSYKSTENVIYRKGKSIYEHLSLLKAKIYHKMTNYGAQKTMAKGNFKK